MFNYRLNLIKNIFNKIKLFPNQYVPGNMAKRATSNAHLDIEVERIVWIDLEMTGLDVDKCTIMEIACLITDSELNIIAEGPNIAINHSADVLNSMHEWCVKQHAKTGLTEACKNSTYTLQQAENEMLKFVSQHVIKGASPLAGNSVYMDRLFLNRYMPNLNNYLHYRIIDVSTIKELCKRWNKTVYKKLPNKEFSHRALLDIKESVEELKYYKQSFLQVL